MITIPATTRAIMTGIWDDGLCSCSAPEGVEVAVGACSDALSSKHCDEPCCASVQQLVFVLSLRVNEMVYLYPPLSEATT